MTVIAALASPPRIVAFDAYGTLFDVHSAVMRHAALIGPQAQAFSDVMRVKQLEYTWTLSLMDRYRDFWEVTGAALDYALAKFPGVDRAVRPLVMEAYRRLDAYPEAAAVLDRLNAAGFTTAILSNGEPTMLAEGAASAGLDSRLDAMLSIDAVGVFKTDPRTYRMVTDHYGCAPHEVLFVSSNRWDVAGAAAVGFVPVWVNRAGNPPEYVGLEPVATVSDLNGVG